MLPLVFSVSSKTPIRLQIASAVPWGTKESLFNAAESSLNACVEQSIFHHNGFLSAFSDTMAKLLSQLSPEH